MYSRAYSYDSNGNTLSDDTKTYTYDAKNRLISFTDEADTGIYTYDTAGRRLSKTYGGSTTEYLYCTTCRYAQVLEERDDLGNITAQYYIGNDLISREDGAQELSYLYDGHGSVRKLINEYGSTPATYSYDAYGILLESSGPSSENNDFRYAGEQFDPHLDQYYLRARYYNQNVGRFHTMDTWAGSLNNPITLNKYLYGNGNPVMYSDPSGKMSIYEVSAILAVTMTMSQTAIPMPTDKPKSYAQIGYRPLDFGGLTDLFGNILIVGEDSSIDDIKNTVFAHQNIWFNKTAQVFWYYTDNIGYFAGSLVRPDDEKFSREDYIFDDKEYDADKLIDAIYKTNPKPYSLLGDNILTNQNQYNCQDWIEEVVYYYNKIK
ncbi:MAG TPA: RHS repeat-associated core domain-containing protein [bacterium]|nr:RHS repeat-associated core domain-containing protein [bacterium]